MSDKPFFGSEAAAVFETWNRRGFDERCRVLEAILEQLPVSGEQDKQIRLIRVLLDRARHMGQIQQMPGPTGESNELYLSARGAVLVTCTEWTSALALSGQVTAALACGNPVILHATAEVEWCERFVALLHQVGVPRAVLAMSTQKTLEQLLALPELTLVAPVCRQSELLGLQRKLAQRDGLLVQLAPETDPVGCTTLLQPDHMHRFVTEKTRTINTTAVGGNATLLELGGTA